MFCVLGETALNYEKRMKYGHISINFGPKSKNSKSVFSSLDDVIFHCLINVTDRHRFDADPDPTFHLMPIQIRILFQIYTCCKICSSLHCLIFLVSVIGVIIFNIFNGCRSLSGSARMMPIRPYPAPPHSTTLTKMITTVEPGSSIFGQCGYGSSIFGQCGSGSIQIQVLI
jgi:hypothetical protein